MACRRPVSFKVQPVCGAPCGRQWRSTILSASHHSFDAPGDVAETSRVHTLRLVCPDVSLPLLSDVSWSETNEP